MACWCKESRDLLGSLVVSAMMVIFGLEHCAVVYVMKEVSSGPVWCRTGRVTLTLQAIVSGCGDKG